MVRGLLLISLTPPTGLQPAKKTQVEAHDPKSTPIDPPPSRKSTPSRPQADPKWTPSGPRAARAARAAREPREQDVRMISALQDELSRQMHMTAQAVQSDAASLPVVSRLP